MSCARFRPRASLSAICQAGREEYRFLMARSMERCWLDTDGMYQVVASSSE